MDIKALYEDSEIQKAIQLEQLGTELARYMIKTYLENQKEKSPWKVLHSLMTLSVGYSNDDKQELLKNAGVPDSDLNTIKSKIDEYKLHINKISPANYRETCTSSVSKQALQSINRQKLKLSKNPKFTKFVNNLVTLINDLLSDNLNKENARKKYLTKQFDFPKYTTPNTAATILYVISPDAFPLTNDYIKSKMEKLINHKILWTPEGYIQLSNELDKIIINTGSKSHHFGIIDRILANSDFENSNEYIDLEDVDQTNPANDPDDLAPLNSILYGPPGTGKTFNTTAMAVKIADPDWYTEKFESELDWTEFYKQVKSHYNQLADEGRIVFTTFHQSFSYEDFIEGIRASTDEKTHSITYDIKDGVFKTIALEAERAITVDESLGISSAPKIWKISIGPRYEQTTRNKCMKNNEARIGWNTVGDLTIDFDDRTEGERNYWNTLTAKNINTITNFSETMKLGDILLCFKDATTIQAIGVITSDYFFDPKDQEYAHTRKVNWLLKDIEFNILPINNNTRLVQQTVYLLDRISWDDIVSELKNQNIKLPSSLSSKNISSQKPNYVLIIDEINRGNISRIFGELITLLEIDKRKGGEDSRKVILPYSKKEFSVPSNLYVIGTMNTADKSLAQLDLALRRRFDFIEMRPDPLLLNDIYIYDINIGELLTVINQRIEVLLDRDHLIGHSYFLPLNKLENNEEREAELARIFQKKIIPLLQEYFFADWERIAWVLNDVNKTLDAQFIQLKNNDRSLSDLFNDNIAADLSDRRYVINFGAFDNSDAYKGILSGKPGV